ncbi:hypothetical protein BC827DRAFT_1248370 [Russula dissimulans]|nr:hypothetical protein BC827DRAFT_1248370 [Russula dissimulans]
MSAWGTTWNLLTLLRVLAFHPPPILSTPELQRFNVQLFRHHTALTLPTSSHVLVCPATTMFTVHFSLHMNWVQPVCQYPLHLVQSPHNTCLSESSLPSHHLTLFLKLSLLQCTGNPKGFLSRRLWSDSDQWLIHQSGNCGADVR